jgi:hypothetical protein
VARAPSPAKAAMMITKFLNIFKSNQRTPQDLADQAQRIFSGNCKKWDIDHYEHTNPKDPMLKDLHLETLKFGLPEEWYKLDSASRDKLNEIIEEMRNLVARDF